jgi:type II secretory pathway component PulF
MSPGSDITKHLTSCSVFSAGTRFVIVLAILVAVIVGLHAIPNSMRRTKNIFCFRIPDRIDVRDSALPFHPDRFHICDPSF